MNVLEELFSGDDERAAAAAAYATPEHLPALQAALAGADPDRRWWAVCALAHVPGPAATALLLQAAHQPDPDLRAAGLLALGQRAADQEMAQAVTPLLGALGDSSEYLARLATGALIRIGRPAVPGLIQALENDARSRVRACAARALAAIADPAAIPALFQAQEDESALVRHFADVGLERLGVGEVYVKP